MTVPNSTLDMNSNRISNVANGINNNDAVNLSQLQSLTGAPTGAMMMYASSFPPPGWLMCNGASVSRTTYANLFGVIGTRWGS